MTNNKYEKAVAYRIRPGQWGVIVEHLDGSTDTAATHCTKSEAEKVAEDLNKSLRRP
jgi:hypothetical protein